MGFKILVDGEEVAEVSDDHRRIERVSVQTSRGEAASPMIDFDQDYINLVFSYRLDSDAELAQAKADDAVRSEKESGSEFMVPNNENAKRLAAEADAAAAANAPAEEEEVSEEISEEEEEPVSF